MRRLGYFALAALAMAGVVVLVNYALIQRHMSGVLSADQRNAQIAMLAHYEYFVVPNTLVVDLRKVGAENSPADVFRVLLQFAAAQKEKDYAHVKLAFRGQPKFLLEGSYFKQLGEEYGAQNPVYTMRTFSEHVYLLDGQPAFGTWTGGLLGVLGKQMEDFTEFHKQWYINELATDG